ncbi:MAG: hypothetical protein F2840_07890 [Actinobacteria bacterium]|uniref:Unannotated protein n=1 Tax=freshwater metagenome TaxID=449393 RepID=A0A6J7K690_9ZZZZ|nr:hypothetical protein [Actinomycetota bacterium]
MHRSRRIISVATAVAILVGGLAAPAALAADPEPTTSPSAQTTPDAVDSAADTGAAVDDEVGAEARAKAAVEALRVREWGYARGFGAARDTKGAMLSLYRGKWFVKKADDRRRCILKRESRADYKAVSVGGKYRGAYQMSRPLMRGAAWMMMKEVRAEMGPKGVAIVKDLFTTKSHLWNRYWQDRAFWTIWSKGEGRSHWRSDVYNC